MLQNRTMRVKGERESADSGESFHSNYMLVFLVTLETEQGSLDPAEFFFERAWRYIRVIQGHTGFCT